MPRVCSTCKQNKIIQKNRKNRKKSVPLLLRFTASTWSSIPAVSTMVYRKISTDMKERALFLLQDGWDIEEIVEVLGISRRSISRWSCNKERTGHVFTPSIHRGRQRLLNAAAIDDLGDLINETLSLSRRNCRMARYIP